MPGPRGRRRSSASAPPGTRLVAYVAPDGNAAEDGAPLAPESLAGFSSPPGCPGTVIPTEFVRLDRLPLSRSGKVDPRALPALGRRERGPDADRPSTPVERQLAELSREVSDRAPFGVHDDFFTVGGDSILVLRMRIEAEQRGLAFDLDRFHAHPTIAGLAAQLASAGETAAPAASVTAPLTLVPLIDRAGLDGVEDAFPASQLQRLGMLFHSRQDAGSRLYKDVFRYRLKMPWDEDGFRRAYRRLVRRQPALRSSFDLTGRSTPLQVVLPQIPDALEVVAADTTGNQDVEAYADRMHRVAYPLLDEAAEPVVPMYRMCAFVQSDGIDLVFSFHHALLDGWSVAALISELLDDYLSPAGGDVSANGRGPRREAGRAATGPDAAARRVRTHRARGAPGRGRAPVLGRGAGRSEVHHGGRAGPGPRRALGRRRRRPDHAPSAVAGPAPQVVRTGAGLADEVCPADRARPHLAHDVGIGRSVTTGYVAHARPERAGSERCAGLFLNTIPVRLDGRQRTWRNAVERIVGWERDAFPHRRLPISALTSERGAPVFDTAFNYVNYHTLSDVLRGHPGRTPRRRGA